MKKTTLLFFILFPFMMFGQLELEWKKLTEIPIEENAAIAIDYYNNLYISGNQSIDKLDSNFTKKFHQSSKNWGNITSIDARNPMKIMFFSKDQQLIGFVDNTLTEQQTPMDLSAEGFSYVTQVTYSAQPDKFWIFDNDNSQITLYSLLRTQSQIISNVYGMLHLKEVNQITEHNNQLYIVDSTQGIFILNRFGSWNDFIKVKGIENIAFANNTIVYTKDNQLNFINLIDKYQDEIPIPVDDIQKILINGNRFYLIGKNKLTVFSVKNQI